MDPSWLDDLNRNGFSGAGGDDDLMQYFDIHGSQNQAEYEDMDFSEETTSIKSEFSEHPSPFDTRQESPWSGAGADDLEGTPSEPRANWELSKSFNFEYRRAQMLLQDTAFGRTDHNPVASAPGATTEDYSPAVAQGPGPQPYKYELHLGELPMRSRVETQIKCSLILTPPPQEHILHLPADTIARPRFQLRDDFVPNASTLSLEVDAVVPSDPSKPVYMCAKCIAREKKRAFRKKTLDLNEEHHWNEDRARRLVILNCRELVSIPLPKATELLNGETAMARQVDLPLRLACYCRHHAAKTGYQLVFTIRDWQQNIVARAVSDNIFITDNHKEPRSSTSGPSGSVASQSLSDASTNPTVTSSFESSSDHSSASKRSSSAKSGYHPYARKTNQWDRRSSSVSSANGAASLIGSLSAPSPGPVGMVLGQGISSNPRLMSGVGATPQEPAQITNIVVQRAIPAQGSIRGGVEVTLLGHGFYQGLTAMFGDTPAISTQCWSDNTMISHLPPSSVAGPVVVSFQGIEPHPQSAVFTYINDSEVKLVELALQVVGFKMNGKIEDAADVASRIVNNEYQGGDAPKPAGQSSGLTDGDAQQVVLNCLEFVRVTPGGRIANLNLRNSEGQTMMHLACILGFHDVVVALMAQGANIDMQDVSGMTPLHFAVLFGNRAITRQLLQGHADPFHRHYGGKSVLDIADSTVSDLLPTNQRSYYQELNTSNSSSTLASIVSRENLQPLFSDRPASELPSPLADSGYSDDLDGADDDESILATVRRLREGQKEGDGTHYRDLVKFIFRILGIDDEENPRSQSPKIADAAHQDRPPQYEHIYPEDKQSKKQGKHTTLGRQVIEISVSESSEDENDEEEENSEVNPTDEQVIENWESSPMKQIRNDHMLFTFWIPLLVIAMSYVLSLFMNFSTEMATDKLNAAGEYINNYISRYTHLRDSAYRRRT